jgi:hypothetical protein
VARNVNDFGRQIERRCERSTTTDENDNEHQR